MNLSKCLEEYENRFSLVFRNTFRMKLVSEYLHYLSCRSCTSPSTKWDMCLAQQAKNATRFLKNTNLTDILTTQISRSLSIHLVAIMCSIKKRSHRIIRQFFACRKFTCQMSMGKKCCTPNSSEFQSQVF